MVTFLSQTLNFTCKNLRGYLKVEMSPYFAFFLLTFSFAKEKVSYLLASSIATATATVILSLGVVTCATYPKKHDIPR